MQLALEEVLLSRLATGEGAPALRFWEWSEPALILGSNQVLANEVDREAAELLDFAIGRRMSGGGTMIVEPERTITYSLYAPASLVAGLSFVESFAHLDAWVVDCLRRLGVPAGYRPINDIVSPEGKIGGAAQARRRGCLLHHTTIAYQMEPGLVGRLMRIGRERVSSIGVRSAEKQVSPLARWTDMSRPQVVGALSDHFQTHHGGRLRRLSAAELAEARLLAASKYATAGWIDRLR
ncbi:MAG: lipoate--protein ligase family protein [Candidatus Dormibacteraeota bacterium]|nr:lipoate--protein ligase family protein [Candidatus Dormibacteraeota bacterium]